MTMRWLHADDPLIDGLIARNKAAFVTRDGRGHPSNATADRNAINRGGKERYQQIIDAQEACAQAERLARRLKEHRLRIVGGNNT